MALSKEEISIRLGINAKSVQAGLDSATGYISKWRKKQKTDEEAYTSFWVSEFKKREELAAAELDKRLEVAKAKRAKHAQEVANYEARLAKKAAGGAEYIASLKQKEEAEVASAVRAAERSNRARMLWRERAEKRESKLVAGLGGQDTMSRSVELANKEGKGVFAKASRQLGSYAGNVISGAVMGVVATMAAAVTDLISRAVDKLSDYMSKKLYDTLFGINDRMVAYVDAQHEKKMAAKGATKEIAGENEKLDIAQEREIFEKKSAEDRAKISAEWVKQSNKEYNAAKRNLELAKEYQKELVKINKGKIEATKEGFEAVAKAEAALLEARKKSAQSMADYGKAIGDIKVEPVAKPGEDAPDSIESDPRYEGRQFSFSQFRDPAKTGTAAVDDYLAKIKAGQDAYKSKTDYSQFGKAITEAQKEAAEKTVQKVSIVSIIEEK